MRKVILFFGVVLLTACSENAETTTATETTPQNTQAKVLDSETLKAYRTAYSAYLYKKDNPDFSQDNVEKIVLEEAKALLAEYGEPDLDANFSIDAKNEDELIVKKAFEKYVELSKIKKDRL